MRLPLFALRCAVLGLLVAATACTRLVDAFLYAPDRTVAGAPGSVGLAYEDLRFSAEDGTDLHAWYVPGTRPGPCVVFFHSGAGNMGHELDILRRVHDRLGLAVLLFDYRGFGKSAGRPSESGLYADARAARALVRSRGWDSGGVVLYGRSLGAAVALQSAVESPPAGLVLESPFTSLEDALRTRYPLLAPLASSAVRGRYDNLDRIRRVSFPVLFLHGDRDRIAPIGMGWRLFDACPAPRHFRTIAGAGHNDAAFLGGERYWEAWDRFLAELSAAPGP